MKNSLSLLVKMLLSKNKVSVDKEELSFQLQSHPSYPSLHAVTGVLDHFNISNIAADIPVNSETLSQLPNCFLGQIKKENGKDLATIERKGLDYFVFDSEGKKQKLKEDDFLEKFTGIIVAVEKPEEEKLTKKTRSFRNLFSILFIISFIFFLIKKNINLSSILHLALSITGIFISIAILRQEQGFKTLIGDAFCTGNSDKKDCDAVLTSKGAQIFKNHKLSDLSMIYFSGLALFSLILIPNWQAVHLISLVAVPITLYSIYYQYVIIKKWCLLCLSIVMLLWIQSVISFLEPILFSSLNVQDLLLFFISFSSVYLVWSFLKPMISDINSLKNDKIEAVKFKRNFSLFNTILQTSSILDTSLKETNEIIFGNKNASLEILIVTNPFCGHCKPVHGLVDEIIKKYHKSVKIIIRFNIAVTIKDSNGVKVASRLLELYNTKGYKECLEAMNNIYGTYSLGGWIKKWGNTQSLEVYFEVLKKQKDWCSENAINFTPAIFVNGKSFPKEYKREELLFFIEDLEENILSATEEVKLQNQ